MSGPGYVALLSERADLADAIENYLPHGVCSVRGTPQPRPMETISFRLVLPGAEETHRGRVIRILDPNSFLVELLTQIDVSRLKAILDAPATQTSAAPAEDAPAPEHSVSGNETESSDVYSRIRDLPMPEKQRLARHGNKTVRQLLMRQGLKPLHIFVFQNPKLTIDEVLEYTAMPSLSADAIRLAIQNRTWLASRQLVFNLVRNPGTPLDIAIRLVSHLSKSEWRVLAKATTIRAPIQAQARKLLMG